MAAAWHGLDLPAPWCPDDPEGDAQELFASRFGLPPDAKVRPVQEAAVELARTMDEPGLMVIEAPMGEGKTEAALAVAEIFAARSGAGGVLFALPTMATGNAMFPRLLDWLKRLPGAEDARYSVLLAHSKAALNEDFAELMRESGHRIVAVDVDAPEQRRWRPSDKMRSAPAELVAHAWLRGRKKAMLSSFVAGTVDQLLFAGLKSRSPRRAGQRPSRWMFTGMLTLPTAPTPSSRRVRNWGRSEAPDQATSVSRSMALRRFFSR